MTQVGLLFRLVRRDPARHLLWAVPIVGMALFVMTPPAISWLWVVLLGIPVFLVSAALVFPTWSAFEMALPIAPSQLLWGRVLSSLLLVWIPLVICLPTASLVHHPPANPVQPWAFALCFTACACASTAARVARDVASERLLWLIALGCGLVSLLSVPWPGAVALAVVATLPLAGKFWWTHAPEWHLPRLMRVPWRFALPLHYAWSSYTIMRVLLAAWFGLDPSWSTLPFLGLLAETQLKSESYLQTLPVSRRYLLGARLLPIVVALLIGGALSPTWRTPPSIAVFDGVPSDHAFRETYGNPPGLLVPPSYQLNSATPRVPAVVAPWGESAEPTSYRTFSPLKAKFVYNPYWVAAGNSDRFYEWQFARATRDIYGRSLSPAELKTAIRGGLKPIMQQPRFAMLRATFGVAFIFFMATLAAASSWWRVPLPDLARVVLRVVLLFFAPAAVMAVEPLRVDWMLLTINRTLPANPVLFVLSLLAALAPLCWVLDTIFRQMEFPEKPKETA